MTSCEYKETCSMLRKHLTEMPRTSRYMNDKFCTGDFSKCPIYRQQKGYCSPNGAAASGEAGRQVIILDH